MPRNSDSVPSVTMSGGNLSRVIKAAFSAPPATPSSRVSAIASGIGRPTPRDSHPSMIAASPIIDPTDRSMPPVTMIGVSANASSPISTPSRVISNAFPAVAKLCPAIPNTRHSTAMTTSSTHSLLGNRRSASGAFAAAPSAGGDGAATEDTAMTFEPCERRIGDERSEDDETLDRLRPEWADAHVRHRRTDRAEQKDADQRAEHGAAATRDRGAAHDDRRD